MNQSLGDVTADKHSQTAVGVFPDEVSLQMK